MDGLGSIDADQADSLATFEDQGVAVDDSLDPAERLSSPSCAMDPRRRTWDQHCAGDYDSAD